MIHPDGADAFQPAANHRAGYGNRLEFIRGWLQRHPDATLSSGEGAVLLAALEEAERTVENVRAFFARSEEHEMSLRVDAARRR